MHMSKFLAPVLALALGFAATLVTAQTKSAATQASPHFAGTATLNPLALLTPPPASNTSEASAELDLVLQLQASRSSAQTQRAAAEAKLSPTAFQSVLGTEFTADHLPITFALLTDIAADSK